MSAAEIPPPGEDSANAAERGPAADSLHSAETIRDGRDAVTVVARPVTERRCPACTARVGSEDRFCEACGRELGITRAALPRSEFATDTCVGCGKEHFDAHGYCLECGELRRVLDRSEAVLDGVVLITDRGVAHARNEDAVEAAVQREATETLLAVAVCDGVSSTRDPQIASGGAARAGVHACLDGLMAGRTAAEAVVAGLEAAWLAVRGNAESDPDAASCTYVGAAVRGLPSGEVEIAIANVGDSRAYWLAATPEPDDTSTPQGSVSPAPSSPAQDDNRSRQLGTDDSFAQALVDGGMDAESAMRHPQAHALLRWLGGDSETRPWAADCVRTLRTSGPGTLLLCSDGLWNYLPGAADLAVRVAAAAPDAGGCEAACVAARNLVDFALHAGGHDNITVALIPVPLFDRQE